MWNDVVVRLDRYCLRKVRNYNLYVWFAYRMFYHYFPPTSIPHLPVYP